MHVGEEKRKLEMSKHSQCLIFVNVVLFSILTVSIITTFVTSMLVKRKILPHQKNIKCRFCISHNMLGMQKERTKFFLRESQRLGSIVVAFFLWVEHIDLPLRFCKQRSKYWNILYFPKSTYAAFRK